MKKWSKIETNTITNKNSFDFFSSTDWLGSNPTGQRRTFSVARGTFRLSSGQHRGGDRWKCTFPHLKKCSCLKNSTNCSQHAFLPQPPAQVRAMWWQLCFTWWNGDNCCIAHTLPLSESIHFWPVTVGVPSSALVQWRTLCSSCNLPVFRKPTA